MPPEHVRPSPGAHVAADQVAELLEDLLPQAEAAAVTAHVDSCAECSRLRDDLAALPALLATVPMPPMPADVAARLDAAVADAAASRTDRQRAPAAAGSTATVSSLADRRRRFVTRSFAGVAAAAALVVGVLVVGDVAELGSGDDQSAGGGSVADDGRARDGSTQERAPTAASGGLARLRSDDFRDGARAVLSPLAGGDQSEAFRALQDAAARVPGACSTRELRTARVSGSLGPPALLDGAPVTLVASGPARRSLVVAYTCTTGRPVEQQRALVDLTD